MYNADIPNRSDLPSPGRLLRSTVLAAVSAAAILVAVVLPSEYGIDPTGAGRMLGLNDMGETKQQLAAEAAADHAAASAPPPAPAPDLSGLYQRIDAMELALRDLSRTIDAERTARQTPPPSPGSETAAAAPAPGPVPAAIPEPAAELITAAAPPPAPSAQEQQHEASFTLSPGEGIEIKLVMKKGDQANFAWASEGGPVNFDTHGDGPGDLAISYEKGRGVQSDEGTITAEFDGNHGWFWRNRGKQPVTLTLRTAGTYSDIKGLPN